MMISIPSTNTVASPSLATVKETTVKLFDCWQQWSDETFGGKYRDAVETLIGGFFLLVCTVVLRAYVIAKVSLPITLSYWFAVNKQRFLAESGLWVEQVAYKLLPVIRSCDECWVELAQATRVQQEILDYELSWAVAAELLR